MGYINLAEMTKLARLQALNDAIGGNATIVVYDGMYPASPDVTAAANTLVSFACSPTAFGTVTAALMITDNTIANVAVLTSLSFPPMFSTANGVAGWARISDAGGNAIVDLDVGLANSGSSIELNSTELIVDIPVQIVSINISES